MSGVENSAHTAAGVMRGPERTMSSFDLEKRVPSEVFRVPSDLVAEADDDFQIASFYSKLPTEPCLARMYRRRASLSAMSARATAAGPPSSTPTSERPRGTAAGPPSSSATEPSSDDNEFTAMERRVILCATINQACSAAAMGMTQAASLQTKLNLVGGDLGESAVVTATIISSVSACSLILQPLVGSASDTFGRRAFLAMEPIARIGWFCFLSTPALCTTM